MFTEDVRVSDRPHASEEDASTVVVGTTQFNTVSPVPATFHMHEPDGHESQYDAAAVGDFGWEPRGQGAMKSQSMEAYSSRLALRSHSPSQCAPPPSVPRIATGTPRPTKWRASVAPIMR